MSWSYACPWCGAMLNPDKTIILTAAQGDRRVLIGFHPEPGNYELFLPPDVTIEEGDHWDFFCPVCRENLVTGSLRDQSFFPSGAWFEFKTELLHESQHVYLLPELDHHAVADLHDR